MGRDCPLVVSVKDGIDKICVPKIWGDKAVEIREFSYKLKATIKLKRQSSSLAVERSKYLLLVAGN